VDGPPNVGEPSRGGGAPRRRGGGVGRTTRCCGAAVIQRTGRGPPRERPPHSRSGSPRLRLGLPAWHHRLTRPVPAVDEMRVHLDDDAAGGTLARAAAAANLGSALTNRVPPLLPCSSSIAGRGGDPLGSRLGQRSAAARWNNGPVRGSRPSIHFGVGRERYVHAFIHRFHLSCSAAASVRSTRVLHKLQHPGAYESWHWWPLLGVGHRGRAWRASLPPAITQSNLIPQVPLGSSHLGAAGPRAPRWWAAGDFPRLMSCLVLARLRMSALTLARAITTSTASPTHLIGRCSACWRCCWPPPIHTHSSSIGESPPSEDDGQ